MAAIRPGLRLVWNRCLVQDVEAGRRACARSRVSAGVVLSHAIEAIDQGTTVHSR
jgi:hypothetical protein